MSLWSWITTPDGYVEVDKGDGLGYQRIEIKPGPATEKTLTWLDLVAEKCIKYNVPIPWILGIIRSESGGDPNASLVTENERSYGLMAINIKAHKSVTKEQMLNPEQNLDYGVSLVADSYNKGFDLVESASIHNGGKISTSYNGKAGDPHKSNTSPWGLRETSGKPYGYIERVVRSQNYFRRILNGIDTTTTIKESGTKLPAINEDPESPFIKLIPFAAGTIFGYLAVRFTKKSIKKLIQK